MWQTSFYLFGSIGMVWSLIWISLYSDKDCRKNDELPLVIIPKVSYNVTIIRALLKAAHLSHIKLLFFY